MISYARKPCRAALVSFREHYGLAPRISHGIEYVQFFRRDPPAHPGRPNLRLHSFAARRPQDSVAGVFDRLVRAASATLVLLTAASLLGSSFWLSELLTHFRFQFLACSVLLLIFAAVLSCPRSTLVALLVAVVNGWPLLPYLLPGAIDAHPVEASMRILFANVQKGNDNYQAFREQVNVEKPDIIGLAEVDGEWVEALTDLPGGYSYRVLYPRADAHGFALFSRWPVSVRGTPFHEDARHPGVVVVDLDLPQARTTLYLAHPNSPVTPADARVRNSQLRTISDMIRADPNRHQILIGDLNTTPWSPRYKLLEREAALRNAAIGRGYVPTWPAWAPGSSLTKIPIDQCLLSEGLAVQRLRAGGRIGSDHLPLIVDVALPAQQFSSRAAP